jgi:hypothetical protein
MDTVHAGFHLLPAGRAKGTPVNFPFKRIAAEITITHKRILPPCKKKGNKLNIIICLIWITAPIRNAKTG